MLKRILLFLSLLLSQNLAFTQSGKSPYPEEGKGTDKRVLMLYSKGVQTESLEEFTNGFNSYLSNNRLNIKTRTFCLDRVLKRSYDEKKALLLLYVKKLIYKAKIDLIVATDWEAHQLLMTVDSVIPPNIPVVSVYFAGNHIKRAPRFSTFALNFGVEKNFQLGMKMFPKTKEVLYISDTSQYGNLEKFYTKKTLNKYTKKIKIIYASPNKNSFGRIFSKIDSLNPNSFIILSSWFLNSKGDYVIDGVNYPFISKINKTPIIGTKSLSLGTGVIGGYLTSAWYAGYQIASYSARILSNPSLRFHTTIDAFKPSFDFKAMTKWGVRERDLPGNSVFINKPSNIFDDYSTEINVIIIIIALLSVSLVFVAFYNLKYIKINSENLRLSKENAADRKLLDNTLSVMSEGVISFDKDLNIIGINNAARQMALSDIDPIGKKFESLFTTTQPEGLDPIMKLLEKSLEKKERVIIARHTRLNYNNDGSRVISGNISPVVDSENNVSQLVLVFRDVTESYQQKRFLSIAVQSAKSYTWFYNTYNELFVFGENYQNFFGIDSPNQIKMSRFLENVHPEDRKKLVNSLENIIKKQIKDFSVEYRISFDNNNKYEWWERRGLNYSDNSGDNEIIYIYGMDINIDEHKEREMELLEAKVRAEESDRLKSAFLSNMSHEIRTPLNGIVGFANLLTDPGYSEQEREEFVRVINSSSKILMNLISDILDLSRIESNTMNFEFRMTNLSHQIIEITDSYKLSIDDKIQLTTNLPEEAAVVYIDPLRNRQVITNLVNNSLKFTEKGEICIGYTVKEDKSVEIFVSDTGKGIEKEKLGSIFQRFFKVDEFITGTGLGLSICKAIVERFGGRIWAESEVSKGTTIKYTILTSTNKGEHEMELKTDDPTLNVTSREKGYGEKPINREKILIAEDLDSNYQLLDVILSKHYDLIWAKNGLEAVEMFRQHKPPVILMDIKMPVMDGLQATRMIREISPTVAIIAQTANAFESDHQAAFDAGCNDIITKPIKSALLQLLINKYIPK